MIPLLTLFLSHAIDGRMTAETPTKPRKPRGPSKLKPRHYDYLRLRQAGKSQKEAVQLTGLPQKTAYRAENHPEGKRFLAEVAEQARIAGQYGIKEAVSEVDKAIQFAYEQENPNAIAKLLEHKSKLYGLLVEKIDIKATYIDLKGALEQAKARVLVNLNQQDRGISTPSIPIPSPEVLPKGNVLDADCISTDTAAACSPRTEMAQEASSLHKQGVDMGCTVQAASSDPEQ